MDYVSPSLADEMEALVKWVYQKIEREGFDIDGHHDLYLATATHFNLFNDSAAAPLWLSRVIEGIMRDVNENGMTVGNFEP